MVGKTVVISRPKAVSEPIRKGGFDKPRLTSRLQKPISALKWIARPGFSHHAGMTGLTPFYQFQIARSQWSEVNADKVILDHPAFKALSEGQRYMAQTLAIKNFDQASFEKGLTRTFHIQVVLFPVLIMLFALWYLTAGLSGGAALFFGVMIVMSSVCLLAYLFASYVYMVTARRRALIGMRGAFSEFLRGQHGR